MDGIIDLEEIIGIFKLNVVVKLSWRLRLIMDDVYKIDYWFLDV